MPKLTAVVFVRFVIFVVLGIVSLTFGTIFFVPSKLAQILLSLYVALMKTAVGVTIGGLAGLILFKSGNGRRASAVATGVGVAVGSTYERISAKINK
jgi:hypothetical protein